MRADTANPEAYFQSGPALAHLALGGWNADIVSRAGRMMARVMYGARKKEAVAHFERALELAPESKVVLLDYALRLPKLDGKKGRKRARDCCRRRWDCRWGMSTAGSSINGRWRS